MTFSTLCTYIRRIEQTPSRLDMTTILAELFNALTPHEYEKAVYLIQGHISPKYALVQFGMAEKMVLKAIAFAMQADSKSLSAEFGKVGDMGEVAERLKQEQPSFEERPMEIEEVFHTLTQMAHAEGHGSQDEKIRLLSALIRQLDPLSVRYLVRIPIGALRLGFSDMTILDALSWMLKGDKSLRPSLQGAYHVFPDLGTIGKRLKEEGERVLVDIHPRVFTPIIMMRAERLSSGQEIIDQIGECIVEPKFDGFRLQVHKKGNEVRLYTRGLEDATHMYPDIVEGIIAEVKASEVILEGEAIGYDSAGGNFLPFQETVQRKRKYGISEKAKEIPLKLFVFELLYLEGENYINQPLALRKKALEKIISPDTKIADGTIFQAHEERIADPHKIELMFEDAISRGLEGIIAKKIDGTYKPGARGWNWIKFKRSYSSKIDDTIDCVVMGYDFGKGKRTAFGIGAFLVGVYDPEKDHYLTIAKIGTGLTDEEWQSLHKQAQHLVVPSSPSNYLVDKLMECDVWIRPEIVVEIKADEISRSPVHTAGRIMKSSKTGNAQEVDTAGFALRFPRLVRFRDDKTPEDGTSLPEIAKMYQSQTEKTS